MKRTIITLTTLFLTFSGFSQTINFQLDTVQVLQDSDAGSVASADVDNDGDMDILITGTPPVTTTLYKNNGFGTFTASIQPAIVNVYAGAAQFADVDNDGDQDLLITGNTSQTVTTANLYINDGMGNFTLASGNPFEASFGGDIDFGDIDGDGDLDLIITGKNSSDVLIAKLYRNNGSGSFSLISGTPFTPVMLSSTEFVDVDNDNDLDLIISGRDALNMSKTSLYINNGSGSFTVAVVNPFTQSRGDIAFGDTDNDGDQDVLITGINTNGQNIAEFYLNNGSGSFTLQSGTPFAGVSLHSSAFADFNNDGKLDLLQIGVATGGLIGHIYENMGSNNFILVDSTTIAGSYNGTNAVADLNGDGKLDIVTTGTSFTLPNRAPKIYFNQTSVLSANESIAEKLVLNVFPNPTNGLINIETNFNSFSDVKLYDLMGRLIFQNRYKESSFSIDFNVPSGVYLLHISNDKFTYNRKLIVE